MIIIYEYSEQGYQLGRNELEYATRVYIQGYRRMCRALIDIWRWIQCVWRICAIFEALSREIRSSSRSWRVCSELYVCTYICKRNDVFSFHPTIQPTAAASHWDYIFFFNPRKKIHFVSLFFISIMIKSILFCRLENTLIELDLLDE